MLPIKYKHIIIIIIDHHHHHHHHHFYLTGVILLMRLGLVGVKYDLGVDHWKSDEGGKREK